MHIAMRQSARFSMEFVDFITIRAGGQRSCAEGFGSLAWTGLLW
jgi:hypothetical protein